MQIFVARQPILDQHRRVFAYELLFRSGTDNFFPKDTNPDKASASVIHDTLAAFDLDHLCPNSRAFINITRRVLTTELFRLLPRDRVVIELLETIEADDEVLAVCRRARRDGFVLALDDFVFEPRFAPLLDVVDIVKVDFITTGPQARKELAERMRGRPVHLLAEKVESRADVDEGLELGYAYFQGYFFCRPEIISTVGIAPSKLAWLRILSELQKGPFNYERMEAIIRQDLALPVKLLRFINSAGFGLRTEVTSLRHALTLLGEENFRRWASLVALASLADDRPAELFQTSLIRGRLCEDFGRAAHLENGVDLFLMGMLSVVDAMLCRPMSEILSTLGLAHELVEVLQGLTSEATDADLLQPQARPLGSVYALTRAWERGLWAATDLHSKALNLKPSQVAELCRCGLVWAAETMRIT